MAEIRADMVANVIEKDLRQVGAGDAARVEVDAFPGESFMGRIARVAPTLDPATRTAPIEIEIPNPAYRLKPGMYARVRITTDNKKEALVVPSNAVVDVNGRRGVFLATETNIAAFREIQPGIENAEFVKSKVGVNAEFGAFPWERVNPNGGSVSLGHPFGATGARILSMAIKELAAMGTGKRAIVSICADGGLGTVALLRS